MGHPISQPDWKPAPPAHVEYIPESQVLFIENGQDSAVGDDFAEHIVVHYDNDDAAVPASLTAIRIDHAEYVLKPFVDAILAKYGVSPEAVRNHKQSKSKSDAEVVGANDGS